MNASSNLKKSGLKTSVLRVFTACFNPRGFSLLSLWLSIEQPIDFISSNVRQKFINVMKLSLLIYLHINMQMSKAEFRKFCLLPSIKFESDFIKTLRVFSLNCIIPDPTFSIKTAKSLIESSAIIEFLSQQYSEATKSDKKNDYLWSWSHTRNLMKMMSTPPVQRSSWNQYQWMLFWWGQVRKHTQLSKHWYAVQHQTIP